MVKEPCIVIVTWTT